MGSDKDLPSYCYPFLFTHLDKGIPILHLFHHFFELRDFLQCQLTIVTLGCKMCDERCFRHVDCCGSVSLIRLWRQG